MTGARLQGHRPNMPVKKHSNPAQVEKAQAEAIRLLQNQDDMFERYLRKPSMSSVGFLVLDKMTSVTSSR